MGWRLVKVPPWCQRVTKSKKRGRPARQARRTLSLNATERAGKVSRRWCVGSKGKDASKILNYFYARLVAAICAQGPCDSFSSPYTRHDLRSCPAQKRTRDRHTKLRPRQSPSISRSSSPELAAVPVSFTLRGCSPVFHPLSLCLCLYLGLSVPAPLNEQGARARRHGATLRVSKQTIQARSAPGPDTEQEGPPHIEYIRPHIQAGRQVSTTRDTDWRGLPIRRGSGRARLSTHYSCADKIN